MNIFLKTHIVRKGETLEQIAEMYNIPDIKILKDHHYQHVPDDSNHLGHTLFPGQEIFIPDQKVIEDYIFRKKEISEERNSRTNHLIENSILTPDFQNSKKQYSVKVTDFTNDILQNETQYITQLQYLGKEENYFIFMYQKKNLTVNGEKPDMKLYELALQCTSVLFPAKLQINSTGTVEGIKNYHEIRNNWASKHQNLLKRYEGSYSLEYMNEINKTIDCYEELVLSFRRDLFLQFFFCPYYKSFKEAKTIYNIRLSEKRVLYKAEYAMQLTDEILITLYSQCVDTRSQQEIINYLYNSKDQRNDEELLESEIKGNFHLSKKDKILQEADMILDSYYFGIKETTKIKIDLN
ncbi:LysM peptidoglycan-binding domain-containing protein [Chryseobacterium sp. JUb7]|uniref:LysM peptidoglycan-binding domain-containing protein n=1 Tax=Chryseobacterium sp. JUb7 TaxID=2940599 RepID=UPI0021676137|nr:LysM peptidoglycan-binding domain-containing protein [Chryseobacterium sp. JUb7]MCS3532583.1 hypothetical protein [Chryseobacterium sp. JUb7]